MVRFYEATYRPYKWIQPSLIVTPTSRPQVTGCMDEAVHNDKAHLEALKQSNISAQSTNTGACH